MNAHAGPTKDIEMQTTPHEDESTEALDVASLQCQFGLEPQLLRQWPGARAYCRYLESCFQPLLSDEYAYIWVVLGAPRPRTPAACWAWFNAVSSTVWQLRDEDSSIEDVWDHLRSSTAGSSAANPNTQSQSACFIAVFSVLCWSTMTLQPRLTWTEFKGSPSLLVHQQQSDQPGLRMDFVRRPISATFRSFQRTMPTSRWRHPISESKSGSSMVLHVASLNYASLNTIGKIHVVWVNDLTNHLDFDATNRRLSIFKFPSFCALSTLADGQMPSIYVGLLRALYSADIGPGRDHENNVQPHQEVLMSYRLLFGQTGGARKLAKAALKRLKAQEAECDYLLDLLCTRPCNNAVRTLPLSLWPSTCRSIGGSLQEESAYSSQDDFPMFGQRLAKLQEFSLRQQPSKLRDLWRDRRNPLQWYTFWAVLVVGGLSILIAILQLLLGVAQLAVTLAPRQGCHC